MLSFSLEDMLNWMHILWMCARGVSCMLYAVCSAVWKMAFLEFNARNIINFSKGRPFVSVFWHTTTDTQGHGMSLISCNNA